MKTPFKSGTALVTDIKECSLKEEESNMQLLVSFSNGKIWQVEPLSTEKNPLNFVFGIDQFRVSLILPFL